MRNAYYGWWLVGLAGLIMTLSVVPLFYGMTAWFPVLERTFSWTRAQLSLAFSFARVEGSLVGPLAGYLTDKLGPRRTVLIGMIILGAGMVSLGQIQNLWQFYLAFVVASTGASIGTWLPMMTVLNNWFVKRRATAMSRAIAGSSAAGILLVPALAWAIAPENFGPNRWRDVAEGIGIVILVLAFPLSRLVRNRPEDYGQLPDGDTTRQAEAQPRREAVPHAHGSGPDLTWQEALRSRDFWLISWGDACTTAVIITMTVHLGSILNIDRGISLTVVGLVVSTYMAVGTVFHLVGGYLGDRISMRFTLFTFSALQAVAVIVLMLSDSLQMAFLFAAIMGVGFGTRAPVSVAVKGAYFGRRDFGRITGMSHIPMNALALLMPLFAGYMFDRTGSYTVPFIALIIVTLFGATLFLFLGQPRRATLTGTPAAAPVTTGD